MSNLKALEMIIPKTAVIASARRQFKASCFALLLYPALLLTLFSCGSEKNSGTDESQLALISLSPKELRVAPYAHFEVSATFENKGDSELTATIVKYYLSHDSIISSSEDTFIKEGRFEALGSGKTVVLTESFIAPAIEDKYYYGVCAQVDGTEVCSQGTEQIFILYVSASDNGNTGDDGTGGGSTGGDDSGGGTGGSTGGEEQGGSTNSGVSAAYADMSLEFQPTNNGFKQPSTGLIWSTLSTNSMDKNDAVAYCQSLFNYGGWRLPTMHELVSATDYAETTSFPIHVLRPSDVDDFWSSSTNTKVLQVSGNIDNYRINDSAHVVCVKSYKGSTPQDMVDAMSASNRFTENKNASGESIIVTDNAMGLQWQVQHIGSKKHSVAVSTCDQLILDGKSDWRLPTVKELVSLLDFRKETFLGPGELNMNGVFWSSTLLASDSNKAWYVSLGYGTVQNDVRNSECNVRCVRNN